MGKLGVDVNLSSSPAVVPEPGSIVSPPVEPVGNVEGGED